MTLNKHNHVPFFQSEMFRSTNQVTHGFFTRKGGVSSGHLSTLNVSFKKNDAVENVKENRLRIVDTLRTNKNQCLATLEQTHSTICHKINSVPTTSLQGDALVTSTPNLFIGVLTADCVPVLLVDPIRKVIGAAHAGWKGALEGIIPSTIAAMDDLGAQRENIKACIGPCIHQKSYEVGIDVYNKVQKKENFHASSFMLPYRENTWLFNLPGFVEASLRQEGLLMIDNINLNTYTNEDLFFSCRRSRHKNAENFGIQMSLISLL